MTTPWKLSLVVEAHGHDDTNVRLAAMGTGVAGRRSPHVLVRTGMVIVHCLGRAAVTSSAAAWAAAQIHAGPDLPLTSTPLVTGSPRQGVSYPTGSVLMDGRQPWNVTPTTRGLTVTVGSLQVHVRDRQALETHAVTWARACELAVHAFPGKGVPYSQLLDQARISSIQRAAGELKPPRRGPTGRDR